MGITTVILLFASVMVPIVFIVLDQRRKRALLGREPEQRTGD